MKADVITLDAKKAGSVDLDESIFGLPPRADILNRVVHWQLARRRAGTHAVKFRGDVRGTGAKWYRQKGTGNARHGNKKVNIFRGGGRAFGPIPKDHGYRLPKKIRRLGLKTALSAKQADGKLIVLDEAKAGEARTKALQDRLAKIGVKDALIIDGPEIDAGFKRAAANIPGLDILPSQGANVYDILRCDTLILTRAAITALGERLK